MFPPCDTLVVSAMANSTTDAATPPPHAEPDQPGDHLAITPESQPYEKPTFSTTDEQEIRATLALAQQVVLDQNAARTARDISNEDALKMAGIVTDMHRMLNASNIVSHL